MTLQPGKQTTAMHILPNIPRSKDYQTMKLCELIEYNMKSIVIEKSYAKCGGETNPRPYSKISSRLRISLDQ